MRISAHLLLGMATALWTAWAIGQLARDACWVTGLLFDVPAPLAAGILLVSVAGFWKRRHRRFASILLLLAVFPVYVATAIDNHWRRASVAVSHGDSTPLRLVHWNICRGWAGWDRIERALLSWRADCYVLSEVPGTADLERMAAALDDDYRVARCGNMAVVARGTLSAPECLANEPALRAYWFRWTIAGQERTLLAADVVSSVFVARDPVLRRIVAWVAERQPDLIVGDFNAPRRSRALSELPAGYAHAYAAAGKGWSYTWPIPCPVLAIDQCIVGPAIHPLAYTLHTPWLSDHRLQCLDFNPAWAEPRRISNKFPMIATASACGREPGGRRMTDNDLWLGSNMVESEEAGNVVPAVLDASKTDPATEWGKRPGGASLPGIVPSKAAGNARIRRLRYVAIGYSGWEKSGGGRTDQSMAADRRAGS